MLRSVYYFPRQLYLPFFLRPSLRNVDIGAVHSVDYTPQFANYTSASYCLQKKSAMSFKEPTSVNFTKVDNVLSWDSYYSGDKNRLQRQFHETYKKKLKELSGNDIFIQPNLNAKVSLWRGDITQLQIDAIVNAANSSLRGGGGVDGAIHRAAGLQLKEECLQLNGCSVGKAKMTLGYKLPVKHVIHTVGPKGEKPDLLESCYKSCLRLLTHDELRSIAFPCISTGVYGYPQEPAAHVALSTIRKFLEKNPDLIDRVVFCVFLETDVKIYENLLQVYFPLD